jgi:hypothetical protein
MRQERTREPRTKVKVHGSCGRPWTDHVPVIVKGRLQWACPRDKA